MTDVSPYTGRPISEWLDEEIKLYDSAGDKIGNVVEVNPDFLVVQTTSGFLGLGEPKNYFVPRNYVAREDQDDWYLSVDKDQLESMNWGETPTESAWSSDWSQDAQQEARQDGRTRLRRYEEDLDVGKVQRDAGDVTVSKRVVEDTKTVEVPVRREEVNVERRAVSGDASSSDISSADRGEAFSEQSVTVPVMAEDVEIRKVARPVEEIEITKTAAEDTKRVEGTVRREEFDIDDQTESAR
jgi:uncharacterized protein (TIGR02271 family)